MAHNLSMRQPGPSRPCSTQPLCSSWSQRHSGFCRVRQDSVNVQRSRRGGVVGHLGCRPAAQRAPHQAGQAQRERSGRSDGTGGSCDASPLLGSPSSWQDGRPCGVHPDRPLRLHLLDGHLHGWPAQLILGLVKPVASTLTSRCACTSWMGTCTAGQLRAATAQLLALHQLPLLLRLLLLLLGYRVRRRARPYSCGVAAQPAACAGQTSAGQRLRSWLASGQTGMQAARPQVVAALMAAHLG